MTTDQTAETLRALRSRWLTARELAERINYGDQCCRQWLSKLADAGICRVRNRPHEPNHRGVRSGGHLPREYRLHTDFGGLA